MIEALAWAGFVLGIFVVAGTLLGVIKFLVVPRGLSSRVAARVARMVRACFKLAADRFETYEEKDRLLAMQAPVTLLAQLLTWLSLLFLGYGLILWPLVDADLSQALLESGSSMFTLGFASTHTPAPTVVHFLAAVTGLIVVALQVGSLPVLYAAFNRRETVVTLLQSRAGAPAWGPEILARHQVVNLVDRLGDLYTEWEYWAADVAESHTNYPALNFFRSPHPLRSWIVGLLAVLDSAAIYLAVAPATAPTQARLCLRMGFLCLRDIADFMRIPYDPDPLPDDPIELTFEEFAAGLERLTELGFSMERTPEEAWPHFSGWRVNYEALAYRLADLVVAPPGPWSGPRSHLPGMNIVPQRPPDRRPEDPKADLPKGHVGV